MSEAYNTGNRPLPSALQSGASPMAMAPQQPGVRLLPDGGLEVEMFGEEFEPDHFAPGGHYENLSYFLTERQKDELAFEVIDYCEADKESREEWELLLADGVKSLGLNPFETSDNYGINYEGMCTATHPLLLESAVKFQSKFISEMLPAKGPVRTQVFGKKTDDKVERASRVQNHMNYQLTQEMPEYAEEMDKLGFHLPLYGSAFKKMYWSQMLDRPVAEFVHPDKFIVAEGAKSLETAERYTHIIEKSPMQLQQDMAENIYDRPAGVFDLTAGTGEDSTVQDAEGQVVGDMATHSIDANRIHTLYEQHVYTSLPFEIDGGAVLPYVITVERDSQKILSIRRNWSREDEKRQAQQWFTHYKYVPGFGFHGLGLIHLLGDMQKTLTVVLRSLVDSGQYSNLQGGFKLKGARMKGETDPIRMGEFREVESSLQDISKALMPLPFKEPSGTLYQLLEYLTGASQKFADSTEQVIQDSSNYGPVGTTMALLEASVKFFSAVHKRSHRAQAKELKILARLNYQFLPDAYPYDVPYGQQNVLREDYDPKTVDVIPASDPNITSQAHRISLAQTKLQAALQAPQLHNLREVYKDFYIALGVDDIDEFMQPEAQAQPMDPMSDIMAAVQNKPIKAFPGQAHEAHVQFKMAWMQDPTQGGSGMFQQAMPAIQANIQEHQIMAFQEKVQAQMALAAQQMKAQAMMSGNPQAILQVTGAATDPKTQEAMLAQAAQKVAQTNQMLAQQQAQGAPEQIIAQAELMKAQTDARKEQRETAEGSAEIMLKQMELQAAIEREKTRAAEAGRKFEFQDKKLQVDIMKEAAKLKEDSDRERQRLESSERTEKAKLASGERNMFVKEMAAERRDKRKASTEREKAAQKARESRDMGRDGRRK